MISWQEDWNLGIIPIDKQHKNILKAINFLCDWGCKTDARKQGLDKVLRALQAYAEKHFSFEENLLIKIGYAKLGEQKHEHRLFLKKISSIKKQLEQSKDVDQVAIKIVEFLQKWLQHHILIHDQAYAAEVKAYYVRLGMNQASPAKPKKTTD